MTGDELLSNALAYSRGALSWDDFVTVLDQVAAQLDRLRERQVPAGTYELRWEQTGVYQHDPSDPYSWWYREQGGECASFEEALAAANAAERGGE